MMTAYGDHKSSSPRELPPQALAEPDVNVSAHPAPITQPLHRVISNEQTNMAVFVLYDPTSDSPSFDVLLGVCISLLPRSSTGDSDISRSDTGRICETSRSS